MSSSRRRSPAPSAGRGLPFDSSLQARIRYTVPCPVSTSACYTASAVDLKRFIRDVPDFPEPGVLFRDITPLLQNAEAFQYAAGRLSERFRGRGLDAVVAIESRGFLFAAPPALGLGVPPVALPKP